MLLVKNKFKVGDVLKTVYRSDFTVFEFQGICISIKNKKLKSLNSFFVLRNFISGVFVELLLNFNLSFILKIIINKHKKKRLNFRTSKLFYLRKRPLRYSLH